MASDLRFSSGTLTGWEGKGFSAQAPAEKGPAAVGWVSSRGKGTAGGQALLARTIVIPATARFLCCTARAVRGKNVLPDDHLDLVLMTAGERALPKQVRTASGWRETTALLTSADGQVHEYLWPVASVIGQTVRLVLKDKDERPGCYLECSGFQILTYDAFEGREFSRFMVGLARDHKLFPMMRYDSRHFVALSNTDDRFSEGRLRECELMYRLFYDHFRRKAFAPRVPAGKLMVALFDNHGGFEAYLGRKMSPLITGIYHPATNRLVMYDYGQNRAFQAAKQQAARNGQELQLQMDRLQYLDGVERRAKEFRTDTNIATMMHEVAHQLSFNCGMLNRAGDVPLWLAEGLACYCEATVNGAWQGVGEPNPERQAVLAAAIQSQSQLLELHELVEDDQWLGGKGDPRTVLLGYAQSWALFRLLMEERPRALAAYLRLIYDRPTRDRRLADFEQAFGRDLSRLGRRYREYLTELASRRSR
jgi:hypothetical protein